LVGETEVLGENLPRRHFIDHKSHLPDPGANPGRRGGKPATNHFSYGAGQSSCIGVYIYTTSVKGSVKNSTTIKILYVECVCWNAALKSALYPVDKDIYTYECLRHVIYMSKIFRM
jgi:hypothetical protein